MMGLLTATKKGSIKLSAFRIQIYMILYKITVNNKILDSNIRLYMYIQYNINIHRIFKNCANENIKKNIGT